MLPHPIHRPRKLIFLTLAAVAALSAFGLAHAPVGQAVEYPYPYPEPTPPSAPTNPYPYPTPDAEHPDPAAGAGGDRSGASKRVVKVGRTGRSATGPDHGGRTLYSLSAEKNGGSSATRRLPDALEAADGARGHEAARAGRPRDDRPARRQDPGHLPRPAALQVHRRHQARRRIRRGDPGRRRMARRRGQTLRATAHRRLSPGGGGRGRVAAAFAGRLAGDVVLGQQQVLLRALDDVEQVAASGRPPRPAP